MRRAGLAVALGALAGCPHAAPKKGPPEPPPPPDDQPVTLALHTDPGLSGLTVAPDGALWTMSERGRSAYRITLAGDELASLDRVAIDGIPRGLDLEAIVALPGGGFLFGVEGHAAADARTLVASGDATGLHVHTVGPPLPIAAGANTGIEGLCGDADASLAAGESAVERDGARLGQLVLLDGGASTPIEVTLTSATGKLADLACAFAPDAIDVLAIERDFGVSRIIHFVVPRGAAPAAPLAATVERDLAELADGRNFEGLARLPDGRLALVNDNSFGRITGPSELVILPAAPR